MVEPSSIRRKMLQVDFFSHAHRLSTQVNVYAQPLSDQLNDPRVSWIELDIAYISRIEHPGEIIADFALSALRKDEINLAMITGSTDGAVKKVVHTSGFYVKRQHRVLVATGAFEISGWIELTGKVDLHEMLVMRSERFMPIMNAEATVSFFPETHFSGALALINKDTIESFCIDEKGQVAPQP